MSARMNKRQRKQTLGGIHRIGIRMNPPADTAYYNRYQKKRQWRLAVYRVPLVKCVTFF